MGFTETLVFYLFIGGAIAVAIYLGNNRSSTMNKGFLYVTRRHLLAAVHAVASVEDSRHSAQNPKRLLVPSRTK